MRLYRPMGAFAGAMSCSESSLPCWSITEAVQVCCSTASDSGKRALVPASSLGFGPVEGESRGHEPGLGREGRSQDWQEPGMCQESLGLDSRPSSATNHWRTLARDFISLNPGFPIYRMGIEPQPWRVVL